MSHFRRMQNLNLGIFILNIFMIEIWLIHLFTYIVSPKMTSEYCILVANFIVDSNLYCNLFSISINFCSVWNSLRISIHISCLRFRFLRLSTNRSSTNRFLILSSAEIFYFLTHRSAPDNRMSLRIDVDQKYATTFIKSCIIELLRVLGKIFQILKCKFVQFSCSCKRHYFADFRFSFSLL